MDILLIAALLLLAGALYAWQRFRREQGGEAAVYINGERAAAYPLDTDVSVRLETGAGEDYNILVIENGAASVTEANCPDKLCVGMHAVRYAGESIICLPHRLEVRIEGGQSSGVDIH